MQYQEIYKCRLCGKKFSKLTYSNIYTRDIVDGEWWKPHTIDGKPYSALIKEQIIHSCKNGSLGLADIQGFKKVEE